MISFELSNILILVSTGIGLLWAVYNAYKLNRIKIGTPNQYNNFQDDYQDHHSQLLLEIASHIESGAAAFLAAEYRYIGVVIILLALLIFFIVEPVLGQAWTTVAFLVGALTSIISGFIGMRVATFSNYRCAYCAQTKMTEAFAVAYRAGCVMGFALVSFALQQKFCLILNISFLYMPIQILYFYKDIQIQFISNDYLNIQKQYSFFVLYLVQQYFWEFTQIGSLRIIETSNNCLKQQQDMDQVDQ